MNAARIKYGATTSRARWRRASAVAIAALVGALTAACAPGADQLGATDETSPTPASAAVTPTATPSIAPEDAAADAADPFVLAASKPVGISVPSIGVDSELMDLGLEPDGSLSVPPGAHPAGWYTGAPTPGELGPAIVAGHVDFGREAGVFHDLHRVENGDEVWVERADGTTAVFVVTDVQQHAKDEFPTALVYGNIDHAGLRLITCGGVFDADAGSHLDNVVVFAALERVAS